VVVDAARHHRLRRIWRYVGYDECNYTYTPGGRDLLLKLGSMADGPYFIRTHFILCSGDGIGRPKWGSTNVYTENADSNPVYTWDIIDRILDTTVETGCVPFVELGFMPQALTTAPPEEPYAPEDDSTAGGWRYPPRDYNRWRDLIRSLAQHCLERYGLREVSRWYWELWNEPDIFYWQGTAGGYCRLYDYTVAGLTAVLPQVRVGGPATTNPESPEAAEFLRTFLEHCVHGTNSATGERGTRLDFISFHSKGSGSEIFSPTEKHVPMISKLVRNARTGLDVAGSFRELAGREVILSECDPDGWAAGSRHDSPNLQYRNTEYYASYVACAVCKLLDLAVHAPLRVDGMLTWAFQFEDREYFEGLRTLSTNGIDKPVLSVFRMLAELGGMRLSLTSDASRNSLAVEGGDTAQVPPDVSGIAALNGSSEVGIFLCSHHDDWDVHTPTDVSIQVTGLKPGCRYRVQQYLVDSAHSNAHTVWTDMGKPQNPSNEQISLLQHAAMLEMVDQAAMSAVEGKCALTVQLAAHSACLLKLIPAPFQ
jgi:xylan 1,4-beta-xylosidase